MDTGTSSPTKRSSSGNVNGSATRATKSSSTQWQHIPSRMTLIWLAVSLPLVAWDTGYVLMRPHTMPGGYLHKPIYSLYGTYGKVDYIYGQKAWKAHNGFTAAQGTLNVVESLGYLVYLWIVSKFGKNVAEKGKEVPKTVGLGWLGEGRAVSGRWAAWAVLIAFGTSLMTLSKTVLYWLNESYSGFENIGHNTTPDLIFMWIIPNGLWLIFPAYMTYVYGLEILDGLEPAAESKKRR
ncbi:MAG: hypothetical protein M1820_009420 [Bogoriella megaspora]|nr:MAG: hypothetical protein M1820_009420 [Bogoriella megaspora]